MKKIGFVDYFLNEWHADNYPEWIRKASGGTMEVTSAYGLIDAPNGLDNATWCQKFGIQLRASIEEVIEENDYLIVLSPDNPEYHQQLCDLPLRSGKPTYVDKTFAPNRHTADALFDLAEKHGTPMFSSSALRFAKEYQSLDIKSIQSITSFGPGGFDNYAIHQIEPIVALMGADVKQLMYVGSAQSPTYILEFQDGRRAQLQHLQNIPFAMTFYGDGGKLDFTTVTSDYFARFSKTLVEFFETGHAPVNKQETLTIMSIIERGFVARENPSTWISLA